MLISISHQSMFVLLLSRVGIWHNNSNNAKYISKYKSICAQNNPLGYLLPVLILYMAEWETQWCKAYCLGLVAGSW